jgi:ribose transport system ATP-binding protein
MGMALVPGDRHALGGIMSLSAGENIMIERLRTFYHWRLKRRGVTEAAAEVMRSLDVRPPDPALQLGLMSGGNQQKALFGRWLGGEPRILLMHEPTQGVDIAARSRIFSMIRAYVADGNAALCASIDYEQLVTLCDRVMIIADGQQVRMVEGDELSTEELLRVVQESRVAV